MGHKSETQAHSDDVPNTIRVKGVYYYKRRIPSDLVKAAAFLSDRTGKALEFRKYSLKTKDPRTARRMAAFEDAKAEQEFEEKRQELAAEGRKGFDRRTNFENAPKRPLPSLSGSERRDMILRLFVAMERCSGDTGRDLAKLDEVERRDAKETVGTDLVVYDGSSTAHAPMDWDEHLRAFLDKEGVEAGDMDSDTYREMRDLLQRAHVENTWRSLETLDGRPQRENDRVFRGYGAESKIDRRDVHTIAALCDSYLEAKQASGVSQASLDKYPT